MNLDLAPVIEAGAAHGLIVSAEAQLPDEVQRREGRGAKAGDVAGVGRDFRLDQGDMQMGTRLVSDRRL